MRWSVKQARRVIIDAAHRVQGKAYTGFAGDYRPGQHLKDDLGLESIQIMDLAAQVSAFFHLMETSPENYLLGTFSVDEWAEKCTASRREKYHELTFLTSGTTGTARANTHQQQFLDREARFLSEHFSGCSTEVPLVPGASIYGYLFPIALPFHLDVPVVFPSEVQWSQLDKSTLIVGTPFTWSHLLRSTPNLQLGSRGVCSTAPLSGELFQEMLNRGVDVTEVYGATVTGGVDLRQNPGQPFELFPFRILKDEQLLMDQDYGNTYMLMDKLQLIAGRHFFVLNRQDQKVKIAGKLVDLAKLKDRIQSLLEVQSCLLSAKSQSDRTHLVAEITLHADTAANRRLVSEQLRLHFDTAERPTTLYFQRLNKS